MTAPDKPLHERIAEHLECYEGCTLWTALEGRGCILLREAAAELSRMRTALEEIRAMDGSVNAWSDQFDRGCQEGLNQCAAIAERALTAGSGNE